MYSLFAGEFRKDVIRAVVVAVVAASIVASVVALAADRYFGDTVSGLIGEYGEYDLQLIVREDMADTALEQIRAITDDKYSGVRIKESISLSGRTYVLVGLPDSMRNAEDIRGFPVQFVNVPGYLGYGVMIEPRVEITGIDSPDVREMLIRRCEQVPGVWFAFEHHGNVAIVFRDSNVIEQATETISQLLDSYTLVDVRFPMSGQIDDLRAVEEQMAAAIAERFGEREMIPSSTIKDEGLGDLTTALSEIRRFLSYYATTIEITGVAKELDIGQHVALTARDESSENSPQIIAMVIDVGEESYKAVVTQGEVVDRQEYSVYEISGTTAGDWLGHAQAVSEIRRLEHSLDSGIELVDGLSEAAEEIDRSIAAVGRLVDNYWNLIASLHSVRQNLQQFESLMDSPHAKAFYMSHADQLVSALKRAKSLVNDVSAGLSTVSIAASAVPIEESTSQGLTKAVATLQQWQDTLSGYGASIDALTSVLEDGNQAQAFVRELAGMTESALEALSSLEVDQFVDLLAGLSSSLDSISDVDMEAIYSELVHIKESLPALDDEEIGRSIRLIDSYLGGQVIPGDRVQLVISGDLPEESVKQVVRRELKEQKPVVTVSSLGTIQPGVRTQVLRVLGEVRATIAALAALVLTVLILLLDHSAIMTVLKKTDARRSVAGGKKVRLGPVYAGLLGAVILSATMVGAKGSIPFVGPWAVFFIGAGIGLCIYALADRVSPVNLDEVAAGVAMGLPYHQVMRDIVIPSGRPGLMSTLNKFEVSL